MPVMPSPSMKTGVEVRHQTGLGGDGKRCGCFDVEASDALTFKKVGVEVRHQKGIE